MAADGSVIIEILGDDSKLTSKLQGLAGGAAKGLATALAGASAAFGVLSKAALDGFADYEQLTGGVETLFKSSSDAVLDYANNAYKTAGLSANQYMETVTGFSASLLQSLGGDTEKAAEVANQAITDMADNANKMGSSMESIQNAYQGFAKQNYTMLDNLKVGYGGTKEEMQRLLADAEKLSGQTFDISSYADIVEAIHVVQTEMGITGTTAAEASSTIQGSLAATGAAWENFLTGMADPAQDFDVLLGNLVDSALTAAGNLLPRIQMLLPRLVEGVAELTEQLMPYVPEAVEGILPALLQGGMALVSGLLAALPSLASALGASIPIIVDGLQSAFPQLVSAGEEMLSYLANGAAEALPTLLPAGVLAVSTLVQSAMAHTPDLVSTALVLVEALAEGLLAAIPALVDAVPEIVDGLVGALLSSLPEIARTGVALLTALVKNLPAIIAAVVRAVPEIVAAIVKGFTDLAGDIVDIGVNIVRGIWDGITSMASWLREKVTGFFGGVVDGVKDFLGIHSPSRVFASIGAYMMEGLAVGMEDSRGAVMESAQDIVDEVKARFDGLADTLDARQDVGNLEFKLWELTEGNGASDAEKYARQMELLEDRQRDQAGIVEAAEAAYAAVAEQYGENSQESLAYQKTLLQEKIQYEELLQSIRDVIAAQQELGNTNLAADFTGRASRTVAEENAWTGNGPGQRVRAASELRAVEASENSVRTAYAVSATSASGRKQDVVLNVNGREFARATLDDYRAVEDANPRVEND